jgi:DNA polymerase III sliding clamp (beta) subunit (PCNA family)
MKMSREEFLQMLEAVEPGIAEQEILEQSKSLVFTDGHVTTFDEELCCRTPTGMNGQLKGAVKAGPVLNLLRKLQDEEIEIIQKDAMVLVRGRQKESGFIMDREVVLPVDSVEKPETWGTLHDDFLDAVALVCGCISTDKEADFSLGCVHIHPKWVEASDTTQIARYRLPTGIQEEILVRGNKLKHVITMGANEFSETPGWIHFRNPRGTTMSCRRYVEEYHDLSPYLKLQGDPFILPKGLTEAAERAAILAMDSADDCLVTVELTTGKVRVRGQGVSGYYTETRKTTYQGRDISFLISPKLLGEIAKKYSDAVISEDKLCIKGGQWRYVTRLGRTEAVEEEVVEE